MAKFFNENNIYPKYILITHEHKDHYEAAISLKKAFPNVLILAPSNFIMQEFKTDMAFSEIQSSSDFENFIFVPLPGHTKYSTGIITPDEVLFLGDVLISKKLLEKYPDTPIENVHEHILSIKKIHELDFKYAVIGHSKNIFSKKETIELCQFNLNNLKEKKGCH